MQGKIDRFRGDEAVRVALAGQKYEISTKICERGEEMIVFLHGLGCSCMSFAGAWKCKELDAFSILCIDYIGHGNSGAYENFSYSIEDHAQVCSDIMGRYKNRPVHLVGHSLGGAVALLLSDTVRESIVSFTNVEGNLNAEDCEFGSRRAADKSYEEFVTDVLPSFRESSGTWLETGLRVVNEWAFYRTAISLVKWSDESKLLNKFRLWPGKKAYFYGSQNSGHYTVGTVQGINCVEISRAGHFVMNDHPEEFYKKLSAFISES